MIDIKEIEHLATNGMLDNGHSLLSPSWANTWSKCGGCVVNLHENRAQDLDSFESVEGTCAHFFLEIALSLRTHPNNFAYSDLRNVLQQTSEDIHQWRKRTTSRAGLSPDVRDAVNVFYTQLMTGNIDDEMCVVIGKNYDDVMSFVNNGWTLFCELKVSLLDFMGHSQCDGTSDVVLVKGSHLKVVDLKYGKGLVVHPQKNKQETLYAIGVIIRLFQMGWLHRIDFVDLVIMQSRINDNHWESWSTTPQSLYADGAILRDASIKALKLLAYPENIRESDFSPSEKACEWCPNRTNCMARTNKAIQMAQKAFDQAGCEYEGMKPLNSFNPNINDSVVRDIITAKPFIDAWLKSVEVEAHKRCRDGNNGIGLKLVRGRRKRSIPSKTESEKINKLINAGVPATKAVVIKAKSPAMLDKTPLPDDVRRNLNKLVQVQHGDPVVTLVSDKRETFNPFQEAQDAFNQQSIGENNGTSTESKL